VVNCSYRLVSQGSCHKGRETKTVPAVNAC
jgi:hypothetical protein